MENEEKAEFLNYIEGTKALAHLLIAQLSLISSKGIKFLPLYSDDTTGREFIIEIPSLLRQMQFFPVNEFKHSIPIVRIYELILDYCKKTDQEVKFRSAEWYDVSRVIRNCFSHNFILKIDNRTREKLPLKWKNIRITEDLIDKPLKYPNSSISNLTTLFDEMTAFGKILD